MTETCYGCHEPRDLTDLLILTNAHDGQVRFACRPSQAGQPGFTRGDCLLRATDGGTRASWKLALAAVPEPPPPPPADPEPPGADLFSGPITLSSRLGWRQVPDD